MFAGVRLEARCAELIRLSVGAADAAARAKFEWDKGAVGSKIQRQIDSSSITTVPSQHGASDVVLRRRLLFRVPVPYRRQRPKNH